jgi:hypothetical protein
MKTILTTWRGATYDVWGNAKDGYDVNDKYSRGTVDIRLKVRTANAGTPQEFKHAYPSPYQIGKVFGTRAALDIDGDDCVVYVNRRSDGYPIGELVLESHESLSPIRETR